MRRRPSCGEEHEALLSPRRMSEVEHKQHHPEAMAHLPRQYWRRCLHLLPPACCIVGTSTASRRPDNASWICTPSAAVVKQP